MRRFLAYGMVFAALHAAAGTAQATSPCPDAITIKQSASLVFEGKVTGIKHQSMPYENCALEDSTQCAQRNTSVVTVVPGKLFKGTKRLPPSLVLVPGYCAPDPSPIINGERFIFYMDAKNAGEIAAYSFVETLDAEMAR